MTRKNELEPAASFLRQLTEGVPAAERRFLCAVSGGLDSMCLLAFVSDWCAVYGGTVWAAHFNHRIRKTADRDETFVQSYCAERSIPFCRGEGDCLTLAAQEKWTLEEAARRLRYAFLNRAAEEHDCRWILTAHHADDHAETILLNLIRGAGSRGLRGIPAVRGNIARPFLELSRSTLEQYAAQRGLSHVEDETNASEEPSRNRLRHQVLPVLRELNPRAVEHMAQAAERFRQEDAALTWAAEPFLRTAENLSDGGVRFRCAALDGVPEAVAARVVQGLVRQAGGGDVSASHVAGVLHLTAQERGVVSLPHGLQAQASRGVLTIARCPAAPREVPIQWGETASFGDGWRVTLSRTSGAWPLVLPENAALSVTPWRPSDRLTLPGCRGARSLKRLCAERGISPQRRDSLPVLRVQDTAAAAADIGADVRFLAESAEKTGFLTFYNTFETMEERNNEQ